MNRFEDNIAKTPKNPLEYGIKMGLQMHIMREFLGKNPTQEEALKWIDQYAKKISDILDDENNKEIRELASQGNFLEASKLIGIAPLEKAA